MIQEEYVKQDTSHRLSNLTLGMVHKPNQFPCLGAKASETLHLLPVVTEICRRMHSGSNHDEHRLRAMQHMSDFYRVLRSADIILTDEQAKQVADSYDWHLLHYNFLNNEALAQNRLLYVLQFKHHHLYHIAQHARYLNPVRVWCYPFEDFVGVCITSGRNCMAGTRMELIGKKVLENWLLVNELSIRDHIRTTCQI